MVDVAIVGGGLAGLCCARRLIANRVPCVVLEGSDAVGGRVRTDKVQGFLLDRGFQVLLDSYPQAREGLDLKALDLRRFEPGALIRFGGQLHRFVDPWRRPAQAISALFSPVATLSDKLHIASVRGRVCSGRLEDLYERPEITTVEYLRHEGFSETIIERFFRPFFGGVFLDRSLETSSRMFEFVFRMFSTGCATLPAAGMQAIPEQIAATFPSGTVRLNSLVASADARGVSLAGGERIEARAVVLAADGSTNDRLLHLETDRAWNGVTCLYFSAEHPPIEEPMLVLNGELSGLVNNLCVPSQVSKGYAPAGKSLVSVSVVGISTADDDSLARDVLAQLTQWFGNQVRSWELLQVYRIPRSLPTQKPPALSPVAKPSRTASGLFVCGDSCDTSSIHGAMLSGERAAASVLVSLGK